MSQFEVTPPISWQEAHVSRGFPKWKYASPPTAPVAAKTAQ
jgi:hypothetical protein